MLIPTSTLTRSGLLHRGLVALMVVLTVSVPVTLLLLATAVLLPLLRLGGLHVNAGAVFCALLVGVLIHNHAPGRRRAPQG